MRARPIQVECLPEEGEAGEFSSLRAESAKRQGEYRRIVEKIEQGIAGTLLSEPKHTNIPFRKICHQREPLDLCN